MKKHNPQFDFEKLEVNFNSEYCKKECLTEERNNNTLKVKLLSENAKLPKRGSESAAGLDLFSAIDETIPGRSQKLIMTDITIQLPKNTYGRIAPRSRLALKN